mmetsp:Transcript_56217/g.133523  ORF Transcript_56217/g.133523 Transcript_56217/m.133523 type:complete len:218 (-) Transcript_56217:540-1193(-)
MSSSTPPTWVRPLEPLELFEGPGGVGVGAVERLFRHLDGFLGRGILLRRRRHHRIVKGVVHTLEPCLLLNSRGQNSLLSLEGRQRRLSLRIRRRLDGFGGRERRLRHRLDRRLGRDQHLGSRDGGRERRRLRLKTRKLRGERRVGGREGRESGHVRHDCGGVTRGGVGEGSLGGVVRCERCFHLCRLRRYCLGILSHVRGRVRLGLDRRRKGRARIR